MGNLSAEDDSLRTGDVQMEGMHHCARPGWDLQFPTGVKREKGKKKKERNVRLDQVTMLTSNPNITNSNHFHGNIAILRSRGYTHTHTQQIW